MSATAEINIRFISRSTRSVYKALIALLDYGWNFGDKPSYYPYVDCKDNEEEYEKVEVSKEEISKLIREFEICAIEGKSFQVNLYWQDTGQRGLFYFKPRKRHHLISVYFLDAPRPRLKACPHYTDVSWFIERIVPAIYRLFDIYDVATSDG